MKRHRDCLLTHRSQRSYGSTSLDCDDDIELPDSSKKFTGRPKKALLRHPSPINQKSQVKNEDYGHGSRQTFLLRRSPPSKFQNNGRSANLISHNDAKKGRASTSNTRPFRQYGNNTNRVDPVFAAAAAAAAMNAGLSTSSSDLNIGLNSGASGNSSAATVAAVAAAAMNAAAMAAALGAGGLFSSKQLESINKALITSVPSISGGNSTTHQHSLSNKSNRISVSSKQLSSGTRGMRIDHVHKGRDGDHNNNFNARFPHHLDHRDPENDPSATRTLFVGNLSPDITEAQLRELFERYGFIEDIDIKRRDPETGANAYAFVRFVNLDMAHRAKVDMSGQVIGQFTCKIGYGKVVPTRCLWVGGLGPWITYPSFAALLDKFGPPERIIWPSGKNYANILFPNVELAIIAANTLRGYPLGGNERRIRVDFTDEAHMINDPLLKRRKLGTATHSQNRHYSSVREHASSRLKRDSPVRSSFQLHTKKRRDIRRNDDGPREQSPDSSDCLKNRSFSRSHKSSRLISPSSHKLRERTPDDDTMTDSFPSHPTSKSPECTPKIHSSSRSIPLTVSTALNIEQLSSCLPAAWDGAFYLKSSSFPCCMHILRGDQSLVDQFMYRKIDGYKTSEESRPNMKDDESHHGRLVCLRITQRMKLDPLKLDDVNQRIEAAGNAGFCVLLAVPSSLNQSSLSMDTPDPQKQPQRPLRNLIAYLRTKDSAGVVLLNPLRQSSDSKTSDGLPITGVLHAFPPCDFAFGLIKECAISLQKDYSKDDHLVILLIRSTGAL